MCLGQRRSNGSTAHSSASSVSNSALSSHCHPPPHAFRYKQACAALLLPTRPPAAGDAPQTRRVPLRRRVHSTLTQGLQLHVDVERSARARQYTALYRALS